MEEGSDSNGIVETTGGNLSPEAWAKEHIEELERPMPHVQLEPNDLGVLSPIETTTIDEEANSVSGKARANGVMANSDSSDDEQENNAKQPGNLKSDNKLEECNNSGESEDDDGEEPYVPNNDESESEDGEPSSTAQSPTKSRNELKKETLQIRSKILSK